MVHGSLFTHLSCPRVITYYAGGVSRLSLSKSDLHLPVLPKSLLHRDRDPEVLSQPVLLPDPSHAFQTPDDPGPGDGVRDERGNVTSPRARGRKD